MKIFSIKYKFLPIKMVVIFLVILILPLFPQHWVNPDFECHLLDLRDLGYPLVNKIPSNSSAITSLLTGSNGRIYGATSGENAYIFTYFPKLNKVRHLGKIEDAEGVHHSLVEDKDGNIYIGTGKNILKETVISSVREHGRNSVSISLWNDIKRVYKDYPGGHIFLYDPKENDSGIYFPEQNCPVEDLGIPVKGNGIYALTINNEKTKIYGLTYPDGHLFEYDILSKKFKDIGEIISSVVFHGPERDWRSIPRALICDELGNVVTSGEGGYIIYYEPLTSKIITTNQKIPGEYYPIEAYTGYPVVEYLVKDNNGLIYGGTCDGYLFSYDCKEKRLFNHGKPMLSRRVRALASKKGKIFMICGDRTDACRLFSFEPNGGVFTNLGVLAVDRSPYYSWRGYQFDCMTVGFDETIYIGESERKSHLFLFFGGN